MKCLATSETSNVLEQYRLPELERLKNGDSEWLEARPIQIGEDSGKRSYCSNYLAEQASAPTLVQVFDTGVWPSSCNVHLASIVWSRLGLRIGWSEEPVILFEPKETQALGALLGLAFVSCWAVIVIEVELKRGFIMDHDGGLVGFAHDSTNLEQVSKLLESLE